LHAIHAPLVDSAPSERLTACGSLQVISLAALSAGWAAKSISAARQQKSAGKPPVRQSHQLAANSYSRCLTHHRGRSVTQCKRPCQSKQATRTKRQRQYIFLQPKIWL